jgi:hypothetical protein
MRLLVCLLLFAKLASAQVVPTTPTKFGRRDLGGGTTGAAVNAVPPKQETIVRTTTYLSLSETRQWTSTEGKPLVAKLIAFEDITIETVKGQTPADTQQLPKLTGKPTVVKDGKVRLMANQHPYEVALDKLSQSDRDFVEKIKTAVAGSK